MVWGKTSDGEDHRGRSDAFSGVLGQAGRRAAAAGRAGSRGGPPIWNAHSEGFGLLSHPEAVRARFWRLVDRKSEASAMCWPFIGAIMPSGYGKFYLSRTKPMRAHRAAWEMVNGPIFSGAHVLHSCDNPACCNPAHLRLGTHADNMADMYKRGRRDHSKIRGEKNGAARLTAEQVAEIRKRLKADESQRALGRAFGVNKSTIARIEHGRSWISRRVSG